VTIATERQEILAALALVARVYHQSNLLHSDAILPLWMEGCDSPGTKTLVARVDGTLIGTMSIVHDDPSHAVTASSYPKTAQYRKQGLAFIDVGLFAVDETLLAAAGIQLSAVAPKLVAHSMRYGIEHEALDLGCVEVSETHSPLYKHLGFVPDGEPAWRDFQGQGKPRYLYPLVLDLRRCRERLGELSQKNFVWRLALENVNLENKRSTKVAKVA
jgi:hypothetical protein